MINSTPSSLLLLFLAAFLAAGISGASGFGGALLLLPLLTHTVGSSIAVPLLTVAQLAGNLSRIVFNVKAIRWVPVGLFLIGGLPGSFLGAFCFLSIPKTYLVRSIGGVIIVFALLSFTGTLAFRPRKALLIGGGAVVGLLSGLIGSAGPLGAAVFLSLGLPPISYVASEAVSAFAMHALKLSIYQMALNINSSVVYVAAVLTVAVVLGTWAGNQLIKRIPAEHFRGIVLLLLLFIGLQMLLFG